MGETSRLTWPGTSAVTRTRRKAEPVDSTTTASRTSLCVVSPTRISPGSAACPSRNDMIKGSPVARSCAPTSPPGHDLAGADPHPSLESYRSLALQLVLQVSESVPD